MFMRYLLYALLIYLVYRFIFNFIIPVYKTTRQVKKEFGNMKSRMEEHMNQQYAEQQKSSPSADKKEKVGDYIDFEEVK